MTRRERLLSHGLAALLLIVGCAGRRAAGHTTSGDAVPPPRSRVCQNPGVSLRRAGWDDTQRHALVHAFDGLPGPPSAGPRLAARLDRHAAAWTKARAATCSAARSLSREQYAAQTACQHGVLAQHGALVRRVVAWPAIALTRADAGVDELEDALRRCGRPEVLAQYRGFPPLLRARAELSVADLAIAMQDGSWAQAIAHAASEPAATPATAAALRRTVAITLAWGSWLRGQDQKASARIDALAEAASTSDPLAHGAVAELRMLTRGVDDPAALADGAAALAAYAQLLGPADRRNVRVRQELARRHRLAGRLAEAAAELEAALAALQTEADDPLRAALTHALGDLEHLRGDYRSARLHHAAALVARERGFGGEQLITAESLFALGNDLEALGELAAAVDHYARAVEIQQRLAPDDLATARTYNNLGRACYADRNLADARRFSSPQTLARHHHRWLAGMLALGTGDSAALAQAVGEADALCAEVPEAVAYHRLRARLQLQAGDPEAALASLAQVRAAARTHLGLAADEALMNASLRREFSGVADLTDQLLGQNLAQSLAPPDRGHALLARAVVHVHAGEAAAALARVDTAWPLLPWWDRTARTLALDLSLEAGDSTRARAWTEALAVPEPEAGVYRAWALLVDGDVMGGLAALADLPQEHPRVAYLQGLALVEQRRFEEAEPWLLRADTLLPGRVEIEVARARVAVHHGDPVTALRKLAGLAEEEVYAPRAFTGLGEAHLAQAPASRDLRAAQKALTRAVEREPRAAEAMLLLAQVWQLRRGEAPEGVANALRWYEQAAATNPRLPRYREALAGYLADLGQRARAEAMLRTLADEPGITAETPLRLADLVLEGEDVPTRDVHKWLATAETLGADPAALVRTRARLDLSLGTATSLRAAQARLEQRLAQDPSDVDSRILLVRVRMAQRDDEAAETLVRNGIYTVGAGSSGRLFLAWAHLELRQRKRKQAALHARAALHRMQAEGRPAVELLDAADLAVGLFLRTEQIKLAQGITRELVRALPDSAEAWRLEARAQLDAGENSKARRAANKAIELAPEQPQNHELRAQIALRTGDRKAAVAALGQAVGLAADDDERARLQEALRRISG